jgi:lipoprotein-releasing system ATP-binding protein
VVLQCRDLHKSYHKAQVEIPVLRGVNLQVRAGEMLAIIGQSGSGKSTLLHLLGTLDAPDKGEVHFAGRRVDNLKGRQRDTLRNRNFGMIFQFYHLIPEMTAIENVLSPLMIAHSAWHYLKNRRAFEKKAADLLAMVGLSHRMTHKPRELSGGEMQRTAIARALISDPQILLADEPTGNLDRGTGQEIMRLVKNLNRQQGLSIVVVTHDLAVADGADRSVRLVEGQLE